MHLDFSLLLVLATLITGAVWLLDRLVLKKRRSRSTFGETKPGVVVEYSNSFFPVLALVLVLRSFLYEPFQIPSGSMLPTLKIGDFILVNKYTYGVRLPVTNTRIFAVNDPQAGDVMVFRYPLDERLNYIKRVIGVAGDRIAYIDKVLYINGEPIQRELLEKYPVDAPSEWLYQEELNQVSHEVYNYPARSFDFPEITVPDGYYFVMGDNRDHSNDSRFWCQGQPHNETGCLIIPGYENQRGAPLVMGFVPETTLVGKAVAVWMHWPSMLSLPRFSDVRKIK
ncbi:MAG: signal peptidase I [Marinospirillum sp.]|uniref:signal peptidase I n=1 Tax=Marinospirillum sp. TaxID=2183934 RepID=UPI001A04C576|nr:signal peptidase I [Marinospirillum sp.]MBE0506200.1 signal peptidase I [Marinospirillum sp.]